MPAETNHFHDYVCFTAASGKECKIIMNKIWYFFITGFIMTIMSVPLIQTVKADQPVGTQVKSLSQQTIETTV